MLPNSSYRRKTPSHWFFGFMEMSKAWIRVAFRARQVRTLKLSKRLVTSKRIVVSLVFNEAHRLPFFIEFYRRMGFEHFIFIDNCSRDNSLEFVTDQPDVSVFSACGSYKDARYGMDWLNFVLGRFCRGKWVLHVDADEFLCFPQSVGAGIGDLTKYLDQRNERSMSCLLLDMYSRDPLDNTVALEEKNPIETLNCYDSLGYYSRFNNRTMTNWVKGGVRGRKFFADRIWDGPALNKTPLVKWGLFYVFLKSAHELWPFHLNLGSAGQHSVSGVLLHTKFLTDFEDKVRAEKARGQHSSEYEAYISAIESGENAAFHDENSRLFEGWKSLVADGLMVDPSASDIRI